MQYVLKMGDLGSIDSSLVGGKFSVLSRLSQSGINVPPGYGLTRKAFQEHVSAAVPENLLNELYACAKLSPESEEFLYKSTEVKKLVGTCALPEDIAAQVLQEYDRLVSDQQIMKGDKVAVRSSGVSEDSAKTSFAGQFDTALYVGREQVTAKVASIFSSYFRPSAIRYMLEAGLDPSASALPACVMRMVPDIRTSAVIFTKHPVSKDQDRISIDFTWGQGEALAQGIVTPDNVIYDKRSGDITRTRIGIKKEMVVEGDSGPKRVSVPEEHITELSCSESELNKIFEIAESVENMFECPQDLEMAISGRPFHLDDSQIWVLQARPITA